ncbi:hypothetical protein IMZ48_44360 [Candidatus Bathyarchaeota archaeon]|nr:hypothetical protein [Candidatus Bathyarchaeota archaeon]
MAKAAIPLAMLTTGRRVVDHGRDRELFGAGFDALRGVEMGPRPSAPPFSVQVLTFQPMRAGPEGFM